MKLTKCKQNVKREEKGCFSKIINVRKSLAQEENQTDREINKKLKRIRGRFLTYGSKQSRGLRPRPW